MAASCSTAAAAALAPSLPDAEFSIKPRTSLSFWRRSPRSRVVTAAALRMGDPQAVEPTRGALDGDESDEFSAGLKKIVIANNQGENLVGILHEAGSRELVILCHGFRSSKESKTLLNLANALSSQKITTFRFDFSGNGKSEGTFQYGNYWNEVEDLRSVVLYFSKQKRKTKAIVGHSKGGNVVVLYASKYRDISTIVNISGRFDLKTGINERLGDDYMERIKQDGYLDVKDMLERYNYRVTEESLMDRLNTDMQAACLLIDQNCRVLTVHGSRDDVVTPESALGFDEFISNHGLQIIEGADHRYSSHPSALAEVVLKFIGAEQGAT